jgi:hypothetical protein
MIHLPFIPSNVPQDKPLFQTLSCLFKSRSSKKPRQLSRLFQTWDSSWTPASWTYSSWSEKTKVWNMRLSWYRGLKSLRRGKPSGEYKLSSGSWLLGRLQTSSLEIMRWNSLGVWSGGTLISWRNLRQGMAKPTNNTLISFEMNKKTSWLHIGF